MLQHRLFAPKSTLDRRAASSVYPQVAAHTHTHTSFGRAGYCCVPVSLAVQFNSCTQEIIAIGDVLPLEGPSVAIWGDPIPAPGHVRGEQPLLSKGCQPKVHVLAFQANSMFLWLS